jgi:excisionase family DNA binding protein
MPKTRIVEQQVVVDDRDKLLTPEEVCERLNVTRRWLRRADARGDFPMVKVGSLNRYPESAIEEYIESRCVHAGQV